MRASIPSCPPAKDRQTSFQNPDIFLFPFGLTSLWELAAAGEGSGRRALPLSFFFFGGDGWMDGWTTPGGGRGWEEGPLTFHFGFNLKTRLEAVFIGNGMVLIFTCKNGGKKEEMYSIVP